MRSLASCFGKLIVRVILLTLFMAAVSFPLAHADQDVKRVYILNSFNREYIWTNNVIKGIDEVFANSDLRIETSSTFMDLKRVPYTQQYIDQLRAFYKERFKGVDFDAILASDNDAFEFLLNYRDELFPGVPVVFSAINDFDPALLHGHKGFTGYPENTDYKSTLELALKVRPKTKTVVVVSDNTTTGRAHFSAVHKIEPAFAGRVQFEYLSVSDYTFAEVGERLRSLKNDTIVVLLHHFMDKTGATQSVPLGTPYLTSLCPVPCFVVADIRVGLGALGGKVVSGYHYGQASALMVLDILHGKDVKDIPVGQGPNQNMFDYKAMQRFGIAEKDLPEGSIVLNIPFSVLRHYRLELIGFGIIVALLFILMLFMGMEIKRRRKTERTLLESENRFRMLVNSLDSLIYVADMATYEILFINEYGHKLWGDVIGKTCWQVLQAEQTGPCAFCTNAKLVDSNGEPTEICVWEFKNSVNQQWYDCRDQAIRWPDGRYVRLEIATNITARKQTVEALRERGRFIESIVNLTPSILYIYDFVEGRNIYSNEGIKTILGYSLDEIHTIGTKLIEELMHPDDFKVYIEETFPRYALTKDGEQIFHQYRMRHKSGTWRWLDCIEIIYQREADGLPRQILGVVHDVTERKQYEATLHQLKVKIGEQELYSVVVENAADGFWLLDKKFLTVYVNPALEEMLGYAQDEMIGRSWYDFGDPDWVVRAKELEKRREGGVKEPHEFLFIHKQGRKVLTRIATTPLYDKDGSFDGALGILSDITRQKEAERALKIKDMLNAIAKSAGIGMVIINPDYTVAWCNNLYEQWFGNLEKIEGRNCFEVFAGRDTVCPGCPSQKSFKTGGNATIQCAGITTSTGTDRIMALTTSSIRDAGGKVLQVVEITQDITEQMRQGEEIRRLNAELEQRVRERTGQLETANKELEAFCYSVSHDLRAPLRHIDGYVGLLVSRCRGELSDNGLHYVDTIADSARQMGALIDDLLQFSRTGREEMQRQRTDMNMALQEALALVQESLSARNIEWIISELPAVLGDYPLLRQVWVNLLENAAKYTRSREIARIEVSARRETDDIIFAVKDNGVGFDMQYADKLFGVFQRLHSMEEFEGTGIGLATVQRIITRHGGRIWAEAEPDHGASFYFTLPACDE